MTRLNQKIREKIISNAIEQSGVIDRQENVNERRANLANDIRIRAIGGDQVEKDLSEKMRKLKAYVKKNSHHGIDCRIYENGMNDKIYVNFAGRAVNLHFNGDENGNKKRVIKYTGKNGWQKRFAITNGEPEIEEFDDICAEQDQINKIIETITTETRAIVNSVTTVKKLLEIWPEVKDLLPEDEKQRSTVIIANVAGLNTVIGLPKES